MSIQALTKEDIWREYLRSRSVELRNQLVMSYIHLVKYTVLRLIPSYGGCLDMDDLMSYGVMGLIDAVERYNADKGAKFETYASLRIKGTIIDQLRKLDWVPRNVRSKVKEIRECFEALEKKNGRQAAEEEVAEELNMGIDELQQLLFVSHTFQVVALDDQLVNAVGKINGSISDESTPEQHYEEKELKEILTQLLNQLSERERMVMTLYYYEELTLKEIGKVLGVTESRVCQIHSKALMILRSKLGKLLA